MKVNAISSSQPASPADHHSGGAIQLLPSLRSLFSGVALDVTPQIDENSRSSLHSPSVAA
jgi:hypothetical protein